MARKKTAAAPKAAKAKAPLTSFTGLVNGLDVFANEARPVRALVWITDTPQNEIQVEVFEPRLQSALELASGKQCPAEVTYVDHGAGKVAIRVRLLDR